VISEDWYYAEKDNAHAAVWANVKRIEQDQGEYFDRLRLLEALYDPHSPTGDDQSSAPSRQVNVTENLVASNVDAVFATTFQADVRPRYLTDGADFSTQRRAKKMEYYSEGLGEQLELNRKCRLAAKEAPKKGAGIIKVYATRWDEPAIEHVRLEDLYVPDEDSDSGGEPLQMHHVQRNYDRDRLKAEYPDHADEIDTLYGMRTGTTLDAYATGSLTARRKLTVIESVRLPIGKRPANDSKPAKGKARYVPGRRTVTIENATLVDEPYHKPYHQYAVMSWSERQGSFYPISGAERIAGHQNALNKRNWQIERVLDQNAMVTTYVRPGDSNLQVRTTKIGNVVTIKGDYPQAPILPAVHTETYNSRVDIRESAKVEFGLPNLADGRSIPAGLETGAAVREARAAQTQHFSPQESAFEAFVLDVHWLLVDVCKDLGAAAPTVLESRWHKPIKWSDVDMGQVKIQIEAASTLPRMPAGREQTLLEWAQAGIISSDSARRLIGHPDLERELSMYTSALEAIEMTIEEIFDGGQGWPEPFDNLRMVVWRGTASYNNARIAGAPEDVLDALGDYISQASFLVDQMAVNDNAAASSGAAPTPGEVPAPGGQPTAALAPEAMQLRAG
jgi:hypothetical protein